MLCCIYCVQVKDILKRGGYVIDEVTVMDLGTIRANSWLVSAKPLNTAFSPDLRIKAQPCERLT